jgi:hypothetical protein
MKSLVHRLLIESVHENLVGWSGYIYFCCNNNKYTKHVYSLRFLILCVFYTTKSICLGPQLQKTTRPNLFLHIYINRTCTRKS